MLVVGRIEVGEIELAELGRAGEGDHVPLHRAAGPGEERRHPESERLEGTRGPLLEESHLEASGRVDPVGGLEQAGQQDGPERAARVVGLDRVAHRVDASAVLGPEVARLLAEGVGHVPGTTRAAR